MEDVATPATPSWRSVEATAVRITRSRAVPEALQSAMMGKSLSCGERDVINIFLCRVPSAMICTIHNSYLAHS